MDLPRLGWLAVKNSVHPFRAAGARSIGVVNLEEPDLPYPWKTADETLVFRFGPWTLGSRSFGCISNKTNPLAAESGSFEFPPVNQALTYQQMRDDGTISRTLSFDRNAIRYVAHRGKRYFINLFPGSFEDYLSKFSAKTRNTLKRKVRHFAERSAGALDFRIYRSPDEMIEFRRQALTVSLVSYQRKIGFGLPESRDFEANLVQQAASGRACGFLLAEQNKPVAYVFCPIDRDIITYSYCGYDPEFARFSPGTVLLYLIIKWLFEKKEFRMFDLDNDGWGYKTIFATGSIKYLKVIWFPKKMSNIIWAVLHLLVLRAWSGAAFVKETSVSRVRRAKIAVIRLISLHGTGFSLSRAGVGKISGGVAPRRARGLSKPKPARQG